MLPDLSNRINNLIKAMETVIAPGLKEDNSFAKEQAALLVGHLKMLDGQVDNAYLYEMGSHDNMSTLAKALSRGARGGNKTSEAVNSLLRALESMPSTLPLTVTGVTDLTKVLGQKVDEVIRAVHIDGEADFKSKVFNVVLDYNMMQSARERVWFRDNHLDPDLRDLCSLEEMLHTDVYAFKTE